jgi:hypothetical protein
MTRRQGPVSDREYLATLPGSAAAVARAAECVAAGSGDALMPAGTLFAPVTAARYASLAGRGGEDDMFSSNFTGANSHESDTPCARAAATAAAAGAPDT